MCKCKLFLYNFMTDVIRRPERRIEDIQTILMGREKIEGITKFGASTVKKFHNDYVIDIDSDKPGMRIFLVINGSGKLKYSGRYFDREPGAKPLSPAELDTMKEPVITEYIMIDEAIATFQEGININPYEKEIAMQEETGKIAKAVRNKVVGIPNLDVNFCKSKSSELQTKKSEVMPSVANSFKDEDWKIVIEEVRQRIQQKESQQAA